MSASSVPDPRGTLDSYWAIISSPTAKHAPLLAGSNDGRPQTLQHLTPQYSAPALSAVASRTLTHFPHVPCGNIISYILHRVLRRDHF